MKKRFEKEAVKISAEDIYESGYTITLDDAIYSLADLIRELQKLPSNATVHVIGNLEDRPVEVGNNVYYDKDKNAVSFVGDSAIID
ncbi:hypothetical protein FAM4067_00333 [Lacticaseibacillus paracasei]|uniref:hypothetical protein n=1 Tax=Lacticaseibacillus paracasei TaxID=1597 RepID=UPI000FF66336|nr:hypothetical protein [Lacticaseibacillus paracasei]RNE23262.1 hypothetical protein FAM4067_00333 [Lacticaseibacillus paracasei]